MKTIRNILLTAVPLLIFAVAAPVRAQDALTDKIAARIEGAPGPGDLVIDNPSEFIRGLTGKEQISVLSYWIGRGADIDSPERYSGRTLLQDAVCLGDAEVVEFLVEEGADIYTRDLRGATPLMHAAALGDTAKLRYLLSVMRWIDQKDYKGDNALMYAACEGTPEAVEILLSNGFLVSHRDNRGRTPLMKAAIMELNELDGEYDLSEMNRRGRAKTELLIDRGADIHARDYEGMTALMFAIMEGKYGIVELLLEKGASMEDRNIYGEAAYTFYDYRRDYEGDMARVMGFERGERYTGPSRRETQHTRDRRLFDAIHRCDMDSVRIALDRGADVNSPYGHGRILPVQFAVEHGCSVEILKLLVENGASPNASNRNGTTVLMRAVMAGDMEAAELCLSKGADVNRANDYGNTAVIFAARNGDDSMIYLLYHADADLDTQGNSGLNAVMTARQNHHHGTANYLIYLGARGEWEGEGY